MRETDFTIRFAKVSDAKAILAIYKPFIEETAVTFENELPDFKLFEEKLAKLISTHPYLVCEINESVIGYAYCSPHRDRIAYQWTVESSVYLSAGFYKKGIGAALYRKIIELSKVQGFTKILAGITEPNKASSRFHESFGFKKFVTYENVGYKLGAWHNVSWLELDLVDLTEAPKPLLSISEVRNMTCL